MCKTIHSYEANDIMSSSIAYPRATLSFPLLDLFGYVYYSLILSMELLLMPSQLFKCNYEILRFFNRRKLGGAVPIISRPPAYFLLSREIFRIL